MIPAVVTVCKNLNYTVEEVLDHTPRWINAMLKEIGRQDFEQALDSMALAGASQKDINKRRMEFDNIMTEKTNEFKDNILNLEALGGTIEKVK